MRKPIKPKKPYKPSKPQEYHDTSSCVKVITGRYGITKDQFPNEWDHIDVEYDYYDGSVSMEFYIAEKIKDPKFEEQLKKYNKKVKEYNKKLEQYELNLEVYEIKMKEWEKFVKNEKKKEDLALLKKLKDKYEKN